MCWFCPETQQIRTMNEGGKDSRIQFDLESCEFFLCLWSCLVKYHSLKCYFITMDQEHCSLIQILEEFWTKPFFFSSLALSFNAILFLPVPSMTDENNIWHCFINPATSGWKGFLYSCLGFRDSWLGTPISDISEKWAHSASYSCVCVYSPAGYEMPLMLTLGFLKSFY